ncbi:MAG TPA: TraB family protein, partial [Fibrobacteria bacterium]|nr:TraB family protein [Fibrobacteria bacterium]
LLETGQATRSEAEIGVVPAASKIWAWLGWGTTAVILAALVWIGFDKGAAQMGQSALIWALSTAIPAALGTLLAFGHPLTILAAFLSAPITTLVPVLGVGHVTALVQTWLVPPRVEEMEDVTDDLSHFRKWWSNRLLRIVLCFLLPGLPTTIGMALGGWHLFKNI